MKYRLLRSATGLLLASMFTFSPAAYGGWGHLRGGGSGGGASLGYSGYGSSGYAANYVGGGSSGYAAGYGSGGYTAAGYGSSGGYAAYGSVGGSTGGSTGGGPGILRRVADRIHNHIAAKHARHATRRVSYGSSGGNYGNYGSSGYSSYSSYGGGYTASHRSYYGGSSGGGAVSYGSSGGSYGAGSVYYGASSAIPTTAASLVSNTQVDGDAVFLTVAVPGDAKVFVNGKPTTSTGAVRQFVSRGLEPGKSYRFQLRAELASTDGEVMIEEKSMVVTAGEREQVQFAFAESPRPIETAVTLNVPVGAQVTLAGNTTKATGETRTFRTSHLLPGQVWDDYEVEVKLGDEVKRQTVRLIAGDKLQLTFNFDDQAESRLASR